MPTLAPLPMPVPMPVPMLELELVLELVQGQVLVLVRAGKLPRCPPTQRLTAVMAPVTILFVPVLTVLPLLAALIVVHAWATMLPQPCSTSSGAKSAEVPARAFLVAPSTHG